MLLKDYKVISPTIWADVKVALAKHGLELGKASASVDEMIGEIKISFVARDTKMGKSPEAIRWERYAHMWGFHPDWLGKTLTTGSGTATVKGLLNTRSEKCVSLQHATRGHVVCTPDALRRMAKLSGLDEAPKLNIEVGNVIETAPEMRKRLGLDS